MLHCNNYNAHINIGNNTCNCAPTNTNVHVQYMLLSNFCPTVKVEASARAVVRPIKRGGNTLVGIHVRRTDYIKKVSTALETCQPL